jgi:hypothetical protein
MHRATRFVQNATKGLDKALTGLFSNQYFAAVFTLIVFLYAGLVAPKLPQFLATLFDYALFKALFMFLILILWRYDPVVALLATIGFVLSLQALNTIKFTGFANYFGNLVSTNGTSRTMSEGAPDMMATNMNAMAGEPEGVSSNSVNDAMPF